MSKKEKEDKKFLSEIFVDDKELRNNNIEYPIKLEYYRIMSKENKYGIEIIKKEYRKETIKIENEKIINITKDKKFINDLIYKLKENLVTPIGLKDVVREII